MSKISIACKPWPKAGADGLMAAKRVLVTGATGTIGRAVVGEFSARGHQVVCIVRPRAGGSAAAQLDPAHLLPGAELHFAEITDPASLADPGFGGRGFDAVVSCLASRSGVPRDAWAVDYQAQMNALSLAARAELSRTGHYYATESLLLLDSETGRYDADATPETGKHRLRADYRRVIDGLEQVERGEHAVF